MKNYLLLFLCIFIITNCSTQKIEITEQDLFEDFLISEKLMKHFKDKKEINIRRTKELCKKIDCDKSYESDGKKVNIFEIADFFSRAINDYAFINQFDKINNRVDFYFPNDN